MEALRETMRFHCPECGTELRANRTSGANTANCTNCVLVIRIPSKPHPVEHDTDTGYSISRLAQLQAAKGVQRYATSIYWSLVGRILAFLVVFDFLTSHRGDFPTLFDSPTYTRALALTLGAIVLLSVLRFAFRSSAHHRVESLAITVGAEPWLLSSKIGSQFRLLGFLTALAFGIIALRSEPIPMIFMKAFVFLGILSALLGILFEQSLMLTWLRIAHSIREKMIVQRISQYFSILSTMVVVLTVTCVLTTVIVVLSIRQNANTLDRFLDRGWDAILFAVGIVFAASLVLSIQHLRILSRLRLRLTVPR